MPLYAITNFSGAKFAETRDALSRSSPRFRDIVVSGDERLLKPDPEIYRLCLDRNGLEAAAAIFIDDSAANVAGAAALGIDAIHFTSVAGAARARSAPRGFLSRQRKPPDQAERPVRALGEAADLRHRHRLGEQRRQRRLERRRAPPPRTAAGSAPVSVMWKRKRSQDVGVAPARAGSPPRPRRARPSAAAPSPPASAGARKRVEPGDAAPPRARRAPRGASSGTSARNPPSAATCEPQLEARAARAASAASRGVELRLRSPPARRNGAFSVAWKP